MENLDHGQFFDELYDGEDDVLKLDILEMVAAVRQTYPLSTELHSVVVVIVVPNNTLMDRRPISKDFLLRDSMRKRGRCPSDSRSCIVSKRL